MKSFVLFVPLAIAITCRSIPVVAKTLDWTKWGLPKGPAAPTGVDITTTTLSPVVPEAPWLKWAQLKAPVAAPQASSPGGSAPAVTPWSPWAKAKPIPSFIKPKLLPFVSSNGPTPLGESPSLIGTQPPNPAIAPGSSLTDQIHTAAYNDPSSQLLLESLGIPQQIPSSNAPILPWSKPPVVPSANESSAPKKPSAVPETFWSQLLKLTTPKVPKIPETPAKESAFSVTKSEFTPPKENPAEASDLAALPDSPVKETHFPPAFLDQFLKAFPGLSETLLKGDNVPSVEIVNVIQPTGAPVPTETKEIPTVSVTPVSSSKKVLTESPSNPNTPQELFIQLLKLKGIPVSSVVEPKNNTSRVGATVSPSLIPKLPAESTPLKIPAASLEKLGLSEPVLSRLLQQLTGPVEKNGTTVIPTKNAEVAESPAIPTLENTSASVVPTELEPTLPKAPPSNPETLWTEWLKLKTPKIATANTTNTPLPSLIPSSPSTEAAKPVRVGVGLPVPATPEEILTQLLKQKILQIPTTTKISAKPVAPPVSPVKIPGLTPSVQIVAPKAPISPVPATPVDILSQLLKLKTPQIPVPTNKPTTPLAVPPVTIPGLTPPAQILTPKVPVSPVPATPEEILTQLLKLKTLQIPVPTNKPTTPLAVPSVTIPGLTPPVQIVAPKAPVPATPEEILAQLLKLKFPEIPITAKPQTTLVAPATLNETPESHLIAWIKSKALLPTANTTSLVVPTVTISEESVPIEAPVEKTLALPDDVPTTPEEFWTEWLKLKIPPKELAPLTALSDVNTETIFPETELKLPLTAPVAPNPNKTLALLDTIVPEGSLTPAVPVVVDGITIPAEVVAQLLKIKAPVQITPKLGTPTLPLELDQKESIEPISLSIPPVMVDGIPIPEQLVAQLLKLTEVPVPSATEPAIPVPTAPKLIEAPWVTWIKMNSPIVPVIPSVTVPVTTIQNEIIPQKPIVPAPGTVPISVPPEVEWAPLAPTIPSTPAALPETPETVWAQLLKLNSTETVPDPVANVVIEPPWIQWIKMKSPLPVIPAESAVPPTENLISPSTEPETVFASWLKPVGISEAVHIEDLGTTVLEPEVSIRVTEVTPAAQTVTAKPGVVPLAPISEVSKVPIPVGLPETFWAELIKSYALSENKTEAASNSTEPPVPEDPWKEWLQKLDTLVSTPEPETAESVTEESTSIAPLIAHGVVPNTPLHNLTCCEWLAKLLPPNVLNETLKKLQQTRSVNNSPNPRHHHSSEENSSSEEVKRAVVGMPEIGSVDTIPTTKPKLDIVPPGFWDVPTTTEASALSAFVDPAFWAAKKAMFISNLFSALAKVAMNATAEPPPAAAVVPSNPVAQPQILQSGSPVLTLTNNKARSASSDSGEESSESRLKRKSKKKGPAVQIRPFLANKRKEKYSKTSTKPTNKNSKPNIDNKSHSHHSSHHHNHHKHHSVKKSSEATTAVSSVIGDSPHPISATTTENPVDFASLAKALLV